MKFSDIEYILTNTGDRYYNTHKTNKTKDRVSLQNTEHSYEEK